ncbi:uncharacterized protein LOC120330711 [Styela clava]
MENPPSSLALVRRRRQARLRRSLHDVTDEEIEDSVDSSWISLADESRLMCHSGFELVSKRREANARERLRVRNLNSGFAKLRRILPTVPSNRKPSKVDTLQGAIDYIYELEKILEATGGIPNIKKTIGSAPHCHSRQSVTERPFIDDVFTDVPRVPPIRYPPPFNRYEGSTCCLLCPESSSPPSNFFPYTQNFSGMSYLAVPPRSSRLSPNGSNGLPSPTSSMTSEESHHNDHGGVSSMNPVSSNKYSLSASYPVLNRHPITANTSDLAEDIREDENMYAEYEHTENVEHETQYEYNSRQPESEDSSQQNIYRGDNQFESNMKDTTEQPRSYFLCDENINRSTLPPVSFLYGNNLVVDA